jgi:hypothetical protein
VHLPFRVNDLLNLFRMQVLSGLGVPTKPVIIKVEAVLISNFLQVDNQKGLAPRLTVVNTVSDEKKIIFV